MRIDQVKNWLKQQLSDVGQGIYVGTIDGNAEKCLGVYRQKQSGPARICLGGPEQTKTDQLRVSILVHWGNSSVQAEEKACSVWQLFYGLTDTIMDGTRVCYADPGAGPIPLGRDERGVFEYVVEIRLIYEKE